MVYGRGFGASESEMEGEEVEVLVVVAKADGYSGGLDVLADEGVLVISVGTEVEVVGEGIEAARAMLSRRSWRTALRCLRWSLSSRFTLDAARSWICMRGGAEAEREGRRMARRREAGSGPVVDEKVDMLATMGGGLHLWIGRWELAACTGLDSDGYPGSRAFEQDN